MLKEFVSQELLTSGRGAVSWEPLSDRQQEALTPRGARDAGFGFDEHGRPRFQALGLVGHGGQAAIVAAREMTSQRLVAVKTANPQLLGTLHGPHYVNEYAGLLEARLRREIRLLELLDGVPHVVPVLSRSGSFTGRPETAWFAMPLLEHLTLKHLIDAAGGPLAPDGTWEFGRALAASLEALHTSTPARGRVVHRDLTPGNYLLTLHGPKLVDFAGSWLEGVPEHDGAAAGFTHGMSASAGGRWGTRAYRAPEVISAGHGQHPDRHPAADIFCWGLLTGAARLGRHPFQGGKAESDVIETRILSGQPDLTGLGGANGLDELDQLIAEALSADPSRRPTARQILDRLPDVPPSMVNVVTAREEEQRVGNTVAFAAGAAAAASEIDDLMEGQAAARVEIEELKERRDTVHRELDATRELFACAVRELEEVKERHTASNQELSRDAARWVQRAEVYKRDMDLREMQVDRLTRQLQVSNKRSGGSSEAVMSLERRVVDLIGENDSLTEQREALESDLLSSRYEFLAATKERDARTAELEMQRNDAARLRDLVRRYEPDVRRAYATPFALVYLSLVGAFSATMVSGGLPNAGRISPILLVPALVMWTAVSIVLRTRARLNVDYRGKNLNGWDYVVVNAQIVGSGAAVLAADWALNRYSSELRWVGLISLLAVPLLTASTSKGPVGRISRGVPAP